MPTIPSLDRRAFVAQSMALVAAAALSNFAFSAKASAQTPATPDQLLAKQKLLLAQANRILENEGVLTGPGHVSVRHPNYPDRYLMSRQCSPRTVKPSDILEFDLESNPIAPLGNERAYSERFIHGQFYKHRPDVNAVVHSHAKEVLPFTVVDTPMQVVVIDAARLGLHVPIWDIREHFGDATEVMVTDNARAADLVRVAGTSDAVLMRGHGFVTVAESLVHLTFLAIKVLLNADVQQRAMALGKIKPFTAGELASQAEVDHNERVMMRFWDQWLERIPIKGFD